MSDPNHIDQDLRDYLQKEPNLRADDKLKYLRAIFDKHFTFSKTEHVINHHDINIIASVAKHKFVEQKLPMHINGKQVSQDDLRTVSVIEAMLGYFNLHHLSKKEVKIGYTDK